MPKRKSAKRKRSTKQSSTNMTGDITSSSHLLPIATSSPRSSATSDSVTLTPQEIEENLNSLKRSHIEDLEKIRDKQLKKCSTLLDNFNKSSNKYKIIMKRCATLCDLETLRSLIIGKHINGNSKRKVSVLEHEATLPVIPEETETPVKKEKKLKIISDKVDDDDVFKKPTGTAQRTLRSSKQHNLSSFHTPKNGMRKAYNVAMVTPGPNSHGPVNILRRPNPGEMAISMSGSPLLVATDNIPARIPQISIPLTDGRVMTVLANEALDPDMSICSDIDPVTCERLAILQELLAKKTKKAVHSQ